MAKKSAIREITPQKDTIVVFDIRNFSAHRYHLGLPENHHGAKLLTDLIQHLLNDAVSLLGKSSDRKREHLLNHTGDGFVLVIRGPKNQLKALQWISRFREKVSGHIEEYEEKLGEQFPNIKDELKPLDFGIGAHTGIVRTFDFDNFGTRTTAFLGSAVNIASRIEQYTKNYASKVICTWILWKEARKSIKEANRKNTNGFCIRRGFQRLRGFPKRFDLCCLKVGFHEVFADQSNDGSKLGGHRPRRHPEQNAGG
ncbi:MAG: hypothetical protein HZA88_16430 [Verrucomicrobia bacterium]|nr:hypothetical protein [Verrucomicrobiota bacterium]